MVRPPPPISPSLADDVEELELRLLLEGIQSRYGFDFRGYDPAGLRRRVRRRVRLERLASVSALQERVLRDRDCLERLIADIAVRPVPLFHPPAFFRGLREAVIPLLRTYPSPRVWNPGCAAAGDLYSLCILLEEENLGRRSTVYATDLTDSLLERVRGGTLSAPGLEGAGEKYARAGGKKSLAEYLRKRDGTYAFSPSLTANVVFGTHYFGTDGALNEFHLIVCRQWPALFKGELRERLYDLLHRSLAPFGFLGLGNRDALESSPVRPCYRPVQGRPGLFRKVAA